MPRADSEVSALRTILNSSLFGVAWRTALVVGGFILTGVGAYISANTTAVRADVDELRINMQEISAAQSAVTDVQADVKGLTQDVERVGSDVQAVKVDIATMRGILSQMNRRQEVASDLSPWALP